MNCPNCKKESKKIVKRVISMKCDSCKYNYMNDSKCRCLTILNIIIVLVIAVMLRECGNIFHLDGMVMNVIAFFGGLVILFGLQVILVSSMK